MSSGDAGTDSVEHRLTKSVHSGHVVCCEGGDVQAHLLRSLLTTPQQDGTPPQALRLKDARVAAPLDLDALTLLCPLSLENCRFDHPVKLNGVHAPSVRLKGCKVPAVYARQIVTAGDLTLDGLVAGEVVLTGAHIGGVLGLRQARLKSQSSVALDGSRLRVDQEMNCKALISDGEVRLVDARITGTLVLDDARLMNRGQTAFNADRLLVDGAMFCQTAFIARGEVRLVGARITGQLSLDGAKLHNPGKCALCGDRLQVGASMFCRKPFAACGEVRLRNAHVAGTLTFNGAQLDNTPGWALNADGLRVDESMLCRNKFRARGQIRLVGAHISTQLALNGGDLAVPDREESLLDLTGLATGALWLPDATSPGVIDLTGARVGTLSDPAWPAPDSNRPRPYDPRLAGLSYESLAPGTDNRATRLDWIASAKGGYSAHAYDQLEGVFRRAGNEKDAREVAITKRRRHRKQLPRHAALWDGFLDAAVGYGYRTHRSLYALLILAAIGWGVFAYASWDHLRESKPDTRPPEFAPWLYSLDSVLPVINLGQEAAWTPTGFALYWYVFSVLAGWILATALIAAVTAGLARR